MVGEIKMFIRHEQFQPSVWHQLALDVNSVP